MSNPINNDLGINRVQGRAGARVNDESRSESPRTQDSAGPTQGDRVTLTEDAQRLGEVLSAALDSSDVDSARVDALRDAIDKGEYEVDSRQTAEKLVAFERSLSESSE